MVRICIFAVITAVVVVSSFGCGQQGAGNTPSGSTEQATTSPTESPEPPSTTSEATAIPIELGVLECPNGNVIGRIIDHAEPKGKKGTPVEIARREFSMKIREGDTVEIADRSSAQYTTATVRVIREGQVVALIEY
jgi:hypothetical protein